MSSSSGRLLTHAFLAACAAAALAGFSPGCSGDSTDRGDGTGANGTGANGTGANGTGANGTGANGTGGNGTGGNGTGAAAGTGGATNPDNGPPAGNPNPEATCDVPAEAGPADVSNPTTVVGTGTPASCTSQAVIDAVAAGGIITFDCGPDPVVITLDATAKIFNDKGPDIVIDGGGLVTLSGGHAHRILYMNTCDPNQVWTTDHCDNQDTPRLVVQNITFVDGNSKPESDGEGGGAIFASGGRFRLVNTRFFNNECPDTGPDVGGAAVRVFQQYQGLPAYVVHSTFGGADGYGGTGSNGGGVSSIGVSWTIINTLFSYNHAIGNGGNPPDPNTPGGGSGGAIYNDGNTMTLTLCGTRIEYNQVNAYGSAIFFVTTDHTGNIVIDRCNITNNVGGSWYPIYPQISCHDDTPITVTNSVIQ